MAAVRAVAGAPLRVGHVLTGDAWAGAEAQAWHLVHRLPEHGVQPHVALLNPGETAERFAALGVPVTLLDEHVLGRRALARRLRAWMGDARLNLVHTHKYKSHLFSVWATRGDAGPAIVRTLHGAPEVPAGWRWVKGSVANALDGWALRGRTAAVIAVSQELAARFRSRLGRTPLHTIPNGVVCPPVPPAVPPHPPRLVFCGRLAPVKRVDRLIRALAVIRAAVPEAELWIVGTGSEEPALRALARSVGVSEAVQFCGWRPDVPDLLAQSDVVVMSSRHEGLPMIVLEAGAAGKPVVAPRVGGIPEAVRDGETGVLVDDATPTALAAACVSVLQDRARADAMGRAARQHVATNFSVEAMTAATSALYTAVLAGAVDVNLRPAPAASAVGEGAA